MAVLQEKVEIARLLVSEGLVEAHYTRVVKCIEDRSFDKNFFCPVFLNKRLRYDLLKRVLAPELILFYPFDGFSL